MALAERLVEWAAAYKAKGMQEGVAEGVAQGLQQGMQQGIQQGVQQGIQQGVQQGLQQGVQQGEALALQKLLSRRFGALSPEMTAQIASASREQIETWFDKAIDARQLGNVFGSTT